MAEINDGNGIKTIAFYLPQFHSIPENDKAWGKNFTEWTNVKKAEPLFEGQYQPKVPLDNNYYCLLDDDVKIWQAELAKQYGVFGFCYYHYWFKNGKMLLEKPAEQMLANEKVDIPFCFSWANENWSKHWDGGNQELIVEQDYGFEEDWKKHIEYLIPFFKDKRYITLNGEPVFLIYKPEEIPNINEMILFMKREIKKHGFSSICFMIQNPNWFFQPSYDMGEFSYQVKFHPFFALAYKRKNLKKLLRNLYQISEKFKLGWIFQKMFISIRRLRHMSEENKQTILDYDEIWDVIVKSEANEKYIEGAFTDWDNTARKKNGYAHVGASPEKFEKYMRRLFQKINNNNLEKIVFINAWNEWCEGAYLEPDELHGFGYLTALKAAFDED